MDFSKLNQKDLKKTIASALPYVKNPENGIGEEFFDALIKVVPCLSVEAVVVDNIDNITKVLLTKRDLNSLNYPGIWHITGSFIRYSNNISEAIEEVIGRELGVKVKKFKNTGELFSFVDKRGHTIALVCLVEVDDKPKEGKWFTSLPEDYDKMISHHKVILKKIFNL